VDDTPWIDFLQYVDGCEAWVKANEEAAQ